MPVQFYRTQFYCPLIAIIFALTACLAIDGRVLAQSISSEAHYVEMDDGIKIALDVYFPADYDDRKKYPVIMELTRYWRSSINLKTGKVISRLGRIERSYLENGYLVVKVDVRGSGASFGTRHEEYGPREVKDGYATLDWVSKQAWCDGNIGAQGISYSGTTAELICASNHPALKAVVPGWSDFDVYESPGRPYGMYPGKFLSLWGKMVGMMDANDTKTMGGSVRPVVPGLLDQAISDHRENPNVSELVSKSEYRDVAIGKSAPLGDCTSRYWRTQIEKSKVPMLVFASWLDAGTADGALLRFQNYSNPQKVVILASNHGGNSHASPFTVQRQMKRATVPSFQEQLDMRIAFFDHYLKGKKNEVDTWPPLQYFNLGEEKLLSSKTWPPANVQTKRLYFSANGNLSTKAPTADEGQDQYEVNFNVNTGRNNRWMTQMGGPVLNLHNRTRMDRRMLVYTSEPLQESMQISGWPELHLQIDSTHRDGVVIAYLEVVTPKTEDKESMSRYVTEGGLRLIHRKVTKDPDFPKNRLYHSFNKKDASPLEIGKPNLLPFKLWPTSVLIPKGHRIRIAIAGHDNSVFERIPESGSPKLTIFRNRNNASYVELPVIK